MTRDRRRKHNIRTRAAGGKYTTAALADDSEPLLTPAGQRVTPRKPRTYGPIQFPTLLGLARWEFNRARADGLIPAPDHTGRWAQDVADTALAQLADIRAKVGDLPDVGVNRAADALAARLGVEPDPDAVAELARTGLIREAGDYKGHTLYSGRDLAAFRDRAAYETAARTGRLRDRAGTADYLQIRPADVEHLIRASWLVAVTHVHSGWQRRREAPAVPLFRTGDLDALLTHPAIDWRAVRATPAGRRSPLAALTKESGPSR